MVRNLGVVIIGAGPGGYTVAQKASQLSLSMALVEIKKIDGTRANRGCIPIKALLHAPNMLHMMQNCDVLGVPTDFTAFDFGKMQKYKKQAVAKYHEGIEAGLDREKMEVVHGTATLRRDRTVEVELAEDGREFPQGNAVIIAIGVVPTMNDTPGASLPGVWNNDGLLTVENWNSDRPTIMGEGVIAVESATMLSNLCPSVTIVEKQKHLMAPMDDVMSAELEEEFRRKGVQVHCDTTVTEIMEEEGSLGYVITPDHGGGPIETRTGQVLMATGRRPDVDKLSGKDISLEMQNGKIAVNSDFETSESGVFAIGDVATRAQLARVVAAQGTYAVEKTAGRAHSVKLEVMSNGMLASLPIVPDCIYTDPGIVAVGVMEERTKQGGLKARCGYLSTRDNEKSIIPGEENGSIRLVFEAYSNTIVGAQMMCPRAMDIIGEIATTIANGLTVEEMSSAVRARPTHNEGTGAAIENAMRRGLVQGTMGEIRLDDTGQVERITWHGLDDPRRCGRQMS